MFLIIGVWGGQRRVYAGFKFFLYTLLGSVLMLLAILAMYRHAGTTDIPALLRHALPAATADLAVARLLRLLRGQDADVAGAHLAAGRPRRGADRRLGDPGRHPPEDGRLRLPALLAADVPGRHRVEFTPLVFALSVVAIVYTSLVALAQDRHEEADRLFVGGPYGLRHHGHLLRHHPGRSRAASSRCSATAWSRARSSSASAWSTTACTPARSPSMAGWSNRMPFYAAVFMLFTLANVGLPGTSGFVGEFLTMIGAFRVNTGSRSSRHRRDPVGGLCAVSLSPGHLRRARQAALATIRISTRARCHSRTAGGVHDPDGHLSQAGVDVTAASVRQPDRRVQHGAGHRPRAAACRAHAGSRPSEPAHRSHCPVARADRRGRRNGAADRRRAGRRQVDAVLFRGWAWRSWRPPG